MTTVTFASHVGASGVKSLRPIPNGATGIDHPQPTLDGLPFLQVPSRELAAYAQVVAHNLKSPLAAIISTSNAIPHITDLTREELRAYLDQIQSTAHDMDEMIDNLLLLAELDAAAVAMGPLEMSAIVERAEMRLSHLIRACRAEIVVPEAWPVAVGYAPWIEEVWSNFIGNAIKHSGRPARVQLGAVARPDGLVLFWVEHNGSQVPAETNDQWFDSPRPSGAGRGLRLSVTRRVVEMLGGQVGLEPGVGGGSRFYFTLPAQV